MARVERRPTTTATASRRTKAALADDYLDLVREFPLRPVRSVVEYDRVADMLDGLALRNDLSPGQQDYLDALTLRVEAYDAAHHAAPAGRTPLQRVRSLMASAGLSPAGLGDIIGSRPAASMFLNGTRKELSKPQIRRLAAHFKLNAGYFL
jgi:HTH-type transcriptional regulator/antitoxin HigA